GSPRAARRRAASTTRRARSTRSTPSASTVSRSGRPRPAGASRAATPGAAAEWTTRDRRLLESAPPARDRPAPRPRLAARDDRPALGVVGRRADHPRPDPARPADDQADPLDAVSPAPRAGDEGDPAEVQERQAEAAGRADEVLPGEQRQPGRLVPSDRAADAGVLRPLLRAAGFLEASPERVALVARPRPGHLEAGDVALVRLRPARDLRREPDGLDVLHGHDDGQGAAD